MTRNRPVPSSEADDQSPPPPYPGSRQHFPQYHEQPPPPYPDQHVVVLMPDQQPPPPGPMVLYMIRENVRARHCFILKVYLILLAQLAIVAGVTAALLLVKSARKWIRENDWLYIVAICLFLVLLIILVCCDSIRRKWPFNLILLILFTLAAAYMTAVLASRFDGWVVLVTAGITMGSCLIVSLFSLQTRLDLTKCAGIMVIITFSVVILGIVLVCFAFLLPEFRLLNVVYSGIVALIFVVWLAIDTQMLLGNKKYALTVDEYIYAALQLFLDVIYIFWNLLVVVGASRG